MREGVSGFMLGLILAGLAFGALAASNPRVASIVLPTAEWECAWRDEMAGLIAGERDCIVYARVGVRT